MKIVNHTSRGEGALSKRVVSAGIWATLQNLIREGVGFLVFIVLARFFLEDDDFGIIAFSMALLMVAHMFGQAGLNVLIIQRDDVSARQLSATFWFHLGIAIALCLLLFMAAPLVKLLGGAPEIVPVVRVLSLGLPIAFAGFVHEAILQRKMQFRPLAIRRLVAVLISGGSAIIAAYLGAGLWSLVILNLVNSTVSTILLWWFVRWRPTLINPLQDLKTLLPSGLEITSLSITRFLGDFIEKGIIGFAIGVSQLGLFHVSEKMMRSLHLVLTQSINAVAMPAFSETQSDIERTKGSFLTALSVCVSLTTPVFLGVAAVAEPLMLFLLGDQWIAAGSLVFLLAIASSLSAPLFFVDPILIAINQQRTAVKATLVSQTVSLVCTSIGAFWGIVGVCIGVIVRQVISNIIMLLVMKRTVDLQVHEFVKAIQGPYLSGCLMMTCILLPGIIWEESPGLLILILIGVVTYPLFLRLLDRQASDRLIQLIVRK